MAKLEEIKVGSTVLGIESNRPVNVISVDKIGIVAVDVVYRNSEGAISETSLYREDESRLEVKNTGRNWSFDGDAENLRLVTEAYRIALAHHFDPYLAIHTSLVDPLPHQISAVYERMLDQQPLRFLLADDPGAGKTIMAGLLIKELIARGDIERCLIVAPGSLVEQWQDELDEKFNLRFELLTREMIKESRSGNPTEDHDKLIARLDMVSRNEELLEQLCHCKEWDLIVFDEAHRMSASYYGGDVKFTKRYRAGEKLGQHCRHLLLMTATPHNGKEEDFQLFLALLDQDRFAGRFQDGVQRADTSDLMRRLTKEELLSFNGTPLFPERRAYTAKYDLSPGEASLYESVTEYVRNEMNRVARFADTDGKKRNNIGFALQILQRRLASSPAAIYQSLRRRRQRLTCELNPAAGPAEQSHSGFKASKSLEMNLSMLAELDGGDIDEIEEDIENDVVAGTTTAETVQELLQEIETLKSLESQALNVLQSGHDAKWAQLTRILDDPLMIDANGNRRKLIVFTEPKDTLHYLESKIKARLGRNEVVAVIHGGVSREKRREIVERFMQDRELLVLIANDAAGEGVNLQRGHLMVNYDLPWNPNKIEQRFGRIHRIGQSEVCHLWNLVARNTKEGDVYARLLEKLEIARKALGGRVYDVLGELFEGRDLKDLLFDAVKYGDSASVKARLFEKVDGAVDHEKLESLLQRRALTNESMPEPKVREIRLNMERAEAQRLQPCHVQSFFIKAFEQLNGQIIPREKGRWEVKFVPPAIRGRIRLVGSRTAEHSRYERICFEKRLINQQPVAKFICPGHPLLNSVVELVQEKYDDLMKQGAILVDDFDFSEELSVIVLMEHEVRDGRLNGDGSPNIVSRKLQFAAISPDGTATDAGIAPHLNLRPADEGERKVVENCFSGAWQGVDFEKLAKAYATAELARLHLREVKRRRLGELSKVESEVKTRLSREIYYWDLQALKLLDAERQGKQVRLNRENATRRAKELAKRREHRLLELEREKLISSVPPCVRGAMLVVPRGLLISQNADQRTAPNGSHSTDPAARRAIELAAMEAVLTAERFLGNAPKDVSDQKLGYDIESYDKSSDRLRFIEVKGRAQGADSVTVTRQEIIASLQSGDRFITAIVEVAENGVASKPRYVFGPLDTRDPPFDQRSIQFNLKRLLERSEEPV